MTDKDREMFEQWFKGQYPVLSVNSLIGKEHWIAWQAATERAKERERELVDMLNFFVGHYEGNLRTFGDSDRFCDDHPYTRACKLIKQHEESEAE